ncbi:dioxygenase family protein [Nonomuraea gerenzanensis]|uniref:Catechol 1,2-dioxygenase 1 n=1 Tax=Nonomuraea gerenzanensis TaxID=93944 RepID=A0A1M4EL86_9ACTN|nr:carbohydrate-binding protein [Nonomuraea gerenzanensis]UBU11150.1 dioxygenase [Nonomuraea gerenzanensis]SBO99619.1 Catechol 1,2-dioxygenase 1 [Nonomuraea gerenzanensis]
MDGEHTRAEKQTGISRKTLFKAALIATPVPLLAGQVPALARQTAQSGGPLTPTPYCDDGDDPTIPQTEGPYFKPNSPQRAVLPGAGVSLTVSGYVFGLACQPLANVLLDFWQADNNGAYDNVTYNFRGHQYTNAQGAFKLTTIVPGLYPGRTRHIHVKAQAPGRPVLTTQLYFPGEPRNNTDTIFDPRLLMNVRTVGTRREATFDFVLNVPGVPPTDPPTSPPPGGGTWQVGVTYQAGDRVTYGGAAYRCLQGHQSQAGWEPPNVPALWQRA